jgi:hypothetical protein
VAEAPGDYKSEAALEGEQARNHTTRNSSNSGINFADSVGKISSPYSARFS